MEEAEAKKRGGASRLTARVLVSLALVGAVFAVGSVVSGTLSGSDGGESAEERATAPGERKRARERKRPPREYVVEPGDTLLGIAAESGVPVKRLQRLNPDLDPQALATGQVLRLR